MPPVPRRSQGFFRAVALRCPRCGRGPLFRGLFRMHDACSACGLTFRRESGFYLGSIYINYGVTVIVTGAVYATLVMALGLSQSAALGICLAVAVLLPLAFFRHARSLLLALDSAVNRHQSEPSGRDADSGFTGLTRGQLTELSRDDASAGCMMGIAVALVVLFGLLMAGATMYFVLNPPA